MPAKNNPLMAPLVGIVIIIAGLYLSNAWISRQLNQAASPGPQKTPAAIARVPAEDSAGALRTEEPIAFYLVGDPLAPMKRGRQDAVRQKGAIAGSPAEAVHEFSIPETTLVQ